MYPNTVEKRHRSHLCLATVQLLRKECFQSLGCKPQGLPWFSQQCLISSTNRRQDEVNYREFLAAMATPLQIGLEHVLCVCACEVALPVDVQACTMHSRYPAFTDDWIAAVARGVNGAKQGVFKDSTSRRPSKGLVVLRSG